MSADTRSNPVGSGTVKSRYILNNYVAFGMPRSQRTRVTTAQVNAGFTLLPALPGVKWRIIDLIFIAIGGAAATATSVDIVATAGGAAVRPWVVLVAALTQNTFVRLGAANSSILAAGASFTAFDANTTVSIAKQSGGSNLATTTHVDVILGYVADPA